METLKISLIAPPYRPSTPEYVDYGGIEVGVGNLAEYFDNQGHEVHLFSSMGESSWAPRHGMLWAAGLSEAYLKGVLTPQSYWNIIKKDKRMMGIIKTSDIVNNNMMKQICSEIKTKHINENVITCIHAMDPQVKDLPKGSKLRLVTQSYQLGKALRRMYHDDGWDFRTVHPGPVKKERYPYKETKGDRLLYLGRLYEPKGAHRAIKIAEQAKIPIDIVGQSEGDDKEYVERIKKLCDKSEYAVMHGKVAFEDKVAFYQNAKCVVIPGLEFFDIKKDFCSLWVEPFGNISVEAGMCGTPCVVSPTGGWCETVSHGINGFLAGTDEEFVYAIEKIDEIKHWDCRKRALYFDAEQGGKRYLELYKQVLNGDEW